MLDEGRLATSDIECKQEVLFERIAILLAPGSDDNRITGKLSSHHHHLIMVIIIIITAAIIIFQ